MVDVDAKPQNQSINGRVGGKRWVYSLKIPRLSGIAQKLIM